MPGGTFEHVPRSKGGRPRKYADPASKDRAYRERKKARVETYDETQPHAWTPKRRALLEAFSRDETRVETPMRDGFPGEFRVETRAETPAMEHLRGRLEEACQGNFDADADLAPIVALLNQGCDLEADVLPVVARLLPDLPRPLKKWGAPWLVREILSAREQRLAGHRVEAAPRARRTAAIEWDEFVGGYRAGLIQWNTARLGPKPGEPGCLAPAEVLREHGFRP
jgi:hypothetical protein